MPRTTFETELSQLKFASCLIMVPRRRRHWRGNGYSQDSRPCTRRSDHRNDDQLNQTRYDLEDQCYTLLATQSPMAHDLRDIISILLIAIELERIARTTRKTLAEITIFMGNEPLLKPLVDLPPMAELCQWMLKRALDAFARQDAEEAEVVAALDDEIDDLFVQPVFRELMSYIVEDPRTVTRAMNLLFAGHNLERVGDCITNIAERVVYAKTGQLAELNAQRAIT